MIIFDEPSTALTEAEIKELFEIIHDLREKQMGIIYISHRMDEIKVITGRVLLRLCVASTLCGYADPKDSTKDDIVSMMVGRVIYEEPKTHSMVCTGCSGCAGGGASQCRQNGAGYQL